MVALIFPTVAGCSANDRAAWATTHSPADIAAHAVPVAEGGAVLASTGNPAPLVTSSIDLLKYLLTAGLGVTGAKFVSAVNTARVLRNGQDRRGTARVGATPSPSTPPPTPSGGAIKPPPVTLSPAIAA